MISGRPIVWTGQTVVNAIIGIAIVVLGVSVALGFVEGDTAKGLLLGVFGLSLLLGLAAVLPIGGADMPVVIAILNSFTGVAAAITGFQLDLKIGGEVENFFWSFSVNNVFDALYYDYAVASASTPGAFNAYPLPGRTYLLKAGLKL